MHSRLLPWIEWEACWKTRTTWSVTTWWRKCKRKINVLLKKSETISRHGRIISRDLTNLRLQTQMKVMLWPRTQPPRWVNWQTTDMFPTISRDSDPIRLKTYQTKELSRCEMPGQRSRDSKMKTCSGQCNKKRTDSWCCKTSWNWLRSRSKWTWCTEISTWWIKCRRRLSGRTNMESRIPCPMLNESKVWWSFQLLYLIYDDII